jgi:AcrR family transcriptional regulator
VTDPAERPSARREELLDRAYGYVLRHGLADLSLRPLAAAVESSPRVLLYLFGSKDGLLRALLARARQEELAVLDRVPADPGPASGNALPGGPGGVPADVVRTVWHWLADPAHRPLLALWTQVYARSLTEPDGPWAGFARSTVDDWTAVLARVAPEASPASRTLVLAVLRGALLDLLATGDVARTTAAVEAHLRAFG